MHMLSQTWSELTKSLARFPLSLSVIHWTMDKPKLGKFAHNEARLRETRRQIIEANERARRVAEQQIIDQCRSLCTPPTSPGDPDPRAEDPKPDKSIPFIDLTRDMD